ncbi:hypothetical protein SAMN05192554_12257 [Haloarchaeobius iranensis]|uniref:Uncharacterized protein n=1 Tax=Haloarchaeobius iranensis TaxID=996166 RepID=A0A1G9ZVZ9_9EURY|nr:hypothetical protein SAMN05192554_12257 [Haloarchaeobius iranensis]
MNEHRQGINALVVGACVIIHFGVFPAVGYDGILRQSFVFLVIMTVSLTYNLYCSIKSVTG